MIRTTRLAKKSDGAAEAPAASPFNRWFCISSLAVKRDYTEPFVSGDSHAFKERRSSLFDPFIVWKLESEL